MPFARHFSLLGALGVLLVAGASVPASAWAGESHVFKETFGSVAQPSFTYTDALALDQASGDLLVVDGSANTISRFKPNGEPDPFSALATNVIDGKGGEDATPQVGLSFPQPAVDQIAVDNSGGLTNGDIYVAQFFSKVVDVFAPSGKYLGQLTASSEGGFGEICGVAVDPAGALYADDFSGKIHKFTPAANPVVNADSSANFATVTEPCTLAAGAGPTAGSLFVSESIFAPGGGDLFKLDAATGASEIQSLQQQHHDGDRRPRLRPPLRRHRPHRQRLRRLRRKRSETARQLRAQRRSRHGHRRQRHHPRRLRQPQRQPQDRSLGNRRPARSDHPARHRDRPRIGHPARHPEPRRRTGGHLPLRLHPQPP